MAHLLNDLAEAFPADAEKLYQLRESDHVFARLIDEFLDLDRSVRRVEAGNETVSLSREVELRHERHRIKTRIRKLLDIG